MADIGAEAGVETAQLGGHQAGLLATQRSDAWWLQPLVTGVGFGSFVIYVTWAMFQGEHYYAAPYLSPLYSPLMFVDPSALGAAPVSHAWLGGWPSWWPGVLPSSPALFILIFPLSFRTTCYYYRKFYYRAYFATPPACGVGGVPQKQYKGETALFLFQNLHRYTLYAAICYIFILYFDGILALFKDGQFGFGANGSYDLPRAYAAPIHPRPRGLRRRSRESSREGTFVQGPRSVHEREPPTQPQAAHVRRRERGGVLVVRREALDLPVDAAALWCRPDLHDEAGRLERETRLDGQGTYDLFLLPSR